MARIAKWRRDTFWRWQDERQKRHGGGGGVVTPGVVTANRGTFIVTGQDANLAYGRLPMPAAVGTFTLTGQAAGLQQQRSLSAASGSFVVTGVDAALTKSSAGTNFTAVRISHLQW